MHTFIGIADTELTLRWSTPGVKLTGCGPGNRLHGYSPTRSVSAKGRRTRVERIDALMRGGGGEDEE